MRAWPMFIDIGTQDARFVTSFNEPEQANGMRFRWTRERSILHLPRPPAGPAILTMHVVNGYPDHIPAPQLRVSSSTHQLAEFRVAGWREGTRTYRMLVPVEPSFDWWKPIILDSTFYLPADDPRPLGAVLDYVQLTPSTISLPLPTAHTLIMAFALGMLLFTALLLMGLHHRLSFTITLMVAALLALAVLLRPTEVLPFLQLLVAVPTIACGALLLIRRLLPVEDMTPISTQRPHLSGEYMPAVLAIAWWSLPFFQAVQIWDGYPVGVGIETLMLGSITTICVIIACITGYVRSRGWPTRQSTALIARYVLIGLALGAAIHLLYALYYAFTRSGKDFWILFKGTRDWVQGGSFYDLEAVMTNHVGAVFKVPPFYGMLFAPFVFQDGLNILLYHRLLNVGLMIATALVWLRMFRVRPLWWGLSTIVIVLNSRTLADTIAFGQIDLLLLLLLSCALWAMRSGAGEQGVRKGDLLAGALVALGTLFKVYPIILLAFFVLKGRWHGMIGFVIGMLVYNGLALAIVGWEMHRVYLFEVLPNIGGTTSWVENQTISGFLARLTDTPFDAHLFENTQLRLLGLFLSGLLSLGACLIVLRPAPARSTTFALQYCQFLLLMVLAVPSAWMHYETLLILVFGVLLLHLRERSVPLVQASLLALSFALISYGNQWSFNGTTVMGMLTIAGISYKFYGMLILAALLSMYLLEERVSIQLPWPLRHLRPSDILSP